MDHPLLGGPVQEADRSMSSLSSFFNLPGLHELPRLLDLSASRGAYHAIALALAFGTANALYR